MRQITQKAISARISYQVLWEIDMEAQANPTHKRNTILNDGAKMYCYLQDVRRRIRLVENLEVKRAIAAGFAKLFFPELLDEHIIIK